MLSSHAKAILRYMQSHDERFNTQKHYFTHIRQGIRLNKEEVKIALKKLIDKKLVLEIANKMPDQKARETFGNEYALTHKGILYKFTSRWTIISSFGVIAATISTIGGFTFAIFIFLQSLESAIP